MKRTFLLPLLALIVSTIAGCVDQLPTGGNQTNDVIMPLAVGNRWIGRMSLTSDRGLTWIDAFNDTLEAVGSRRLDGDTWFAMRMNGRDTGEFSNLSDGLYTMVPGCTCLRAKYPGEAGDLFEIDSMMVLLPDSAAPFWVSVGIEIVATDTTITVPAGTFTCHLYHRTILGDVDARLINETYEFYAPDIGPIRTDIYTTGLPKNGDAPDRRWELVEYSLK